MRILRYLAAILLVGGLAYWGYLRLFPGDDRVIRERVAGLANLLEVQPDFSQLSRIAASRKAAQYFTRDVAVNIDLGTRESQVLSGRDDLLERIMAARLALQRLHLSVYDIQLDFSPDKQSATADLTLIADVNGEKNALVQELELVLRKVAGEWLIKEVSTIKAVR